MFSHIAYEIQRIRLVLIKNNFNWHHLPCVMLSVYTITQIVQTATRLAKSATLLEKQATHIHTAQGIVRNYVNCSNHVQVSGFSV